ncbi:MAG: SBBP repeat-containing protein [Melioribacteraceae bacterium]
MKKITMCFCLLLFVVFTNSTKSQVKESWVKRYTSNTGVTGADYDEAFAVDIDEQGNVYVTGSSYETVGNGLDITTIKYSPNGTQEWIRSYNNAAHDRGTILKTDVNGNVYVAGYVGYDCITLKYSPTGNLLWEAKFNGTGNSFDAAKALEIDNMGNVILAAQSETAGSSFDIVIIKYNSAGEQLWLSRYNGTGGYDDYPNAMAMDASGNIYIAGEVRETGGSKKDYITLKYNSEGVQQWAKEYGTAWVDDMAYGIGVDNIGNVYVSGQGLNPQGDFVTIKYDPSGNQLWLKNYNGPATYEGAAFLKVDNNGNVYISGRSTGGQNAPDYTTIKYNSDGAEQWIARYNGTAFDTDEVYAIELDGEANIYLTGSSRGAVGAGRDYATVKYNSEGIEQWSMRYDAGFTHDEAYSLAVNSKGEVAVCGYSVGNGTGRDYAVVKYSSTTTGVKNNAGIVPSDFSLSQNYPNPFNPETTISYTIPSNVKGEAINVTLKVFDVLGNEVATLVNEFKQPGTYNEKFNVKTRHGASLQSGIYFYRCQAGGFVQTKKMILLK